MLRPAQGVELSRKFNGIGMACIDCSIDVAYECLQRALYAAPRHDCSAAECLSNLGLCCMRRSKWQAAMRYLQRATPLDGMLSLSARAPLDGDSLGSNQTDASLEEPPLTHLIAERASGVGASARQSDAGGLCGDGMCGFTAAECMQLLAAGKRPWDEDATEELGRLSARG